MSLAKRAVFDVDAGNREAAVQALKGRPGDEYRSVLLAGLRHPWAPAADHAAEALAELRDRAAVPSLVDLLGQPDPVAPVKRGEVTVVREMVRLNHLTNCLICHAPALTGRELVKGAVPEMTRLVTKNS